MGSCVTSRPLLKFYFFALTICTSWVTHPNHRAVVSYTHLPQPQGDGETASKPCGMKCGATQGETPDPLYPEKTIRWQYDNANWQESSPEGSSCWYCDKLWREQIAQSRADRNRQNYMTDLGRNADLVETHNDKRAGLLETLRQRMSGMRSRRRGGFG